jgi:hypothetical protein
LCDGRPIYFWVIRLHKAPHLEVSLTRTKENSGFFEGLEKGVLQSSDYFHHPIALVPRVTKLQKARITNF